MGSGLLRKVDGANLFTQNQLIWFDGVILKPFFDYSMNVVSKAVEELGKAEEFIRIAMFQIHNEDIFRTLTNKLSHEVRVEILTLPYDSINPNVRELVESRFRKLESDGATLHFCKWNVGDPARTTTAVGRWYSFHGKFIVTDKSAIALSANLTETSELDAMIIYNEESKIKEFAAKFDQLLSLFVVSDGEFDGSIHRKITELVGPNHPLFNLPKNISKIHENHWIRHYPKKMCPSDVGIEEKLYITPFDCRGRDFIIKLINDASQYVYISTESFTDLDFSNFLVKTAVNKNLDIKLISGATSQDFTDRLNEMFRELLAHGIKIRTTRENLHAKLIITDKLVMVSSINLNKITLGFFQTKEFWRENTESIFICKDDDTVKVAKNMYLKVFENCYDVEEKLTEKVEKMVASIFKKTFNLRSRNEVKTLFAKLILKKQIDLKKAIIEIGKLTKQLVTRRGKSFVEKDDFISALILYYLSERKHDFDQLNEKIKEIDSKVNLNTALSILESDKLIVRENEYYKLNLDELIS